MLRWFIRILVSWIFFFFFFPLFGWGERERERKEMELLTFVKKVMTIPFESMSGCHSKRKNGMGTFSVKEEVVT